jgi:hypothetical protein
MSKILFRFLIITFIFYFVISLDKYAIGQQTGPHIVTNGPDFATPLGYSDKGYIFPEVQLPKGYQSTATIELKFYENDQEIKPGAVIWTITRVQNKALAWNRGPGAMHGLAWGDSEIDGTTNWNVTAVIGGPSITTSNGTVRLSDVVGERLVTLMAETTINGTPHTEIVVVSFGKGPLSAFSKPPSNGGRQWATAFGIMATKGNTYDNPPPTRWGDFTDASTTFPAADFCGGTVHSGSSDITVGGRGPESYRADFTKGKNINHWRDGDRANRYYSITSKLPTFGQLVAVAAYEGSVHSKVKRKGAALAAGWPDNASKKGYYIYWTDQVSFNSNGYFFADFVFMASGFDKGGNGVASSSPVVACVL